MDEVVKSAIGIVVAQASTRTMLTEEIVSMMASVTAAVRAAVNGDSMAEESQTPACDPKKSVKEKSVVCLECGRSMKILTKKHLAAHGLTPASYREKWGLKKGAPLAAKELLRARRAKMKDMRLWERRGKSAPEAVQ